MMMALGPVIFDAVVNNLQSHDAKTESAFAAHEVINAPPIYEAMGDEEATFTLNGILHPSHFGGLGTLATLEAARAGNVPLPLMMGNYRPLGWVLIKSIEQSHKTLSFRGTGHEVEFSVTLLRVGTPSGMAENILRIFM